MNGSPVHYMWSGKRDDSLPLSSEGSQRCSTFLCKSCSTFNLPMAWSLLTEILTVKWLGSILRIIIGNPRSSRKEKPAVSPISVMCLKSCDVGFGYTILQILSHIWNKLMAVHFNLCITACGHRMAHRKWKEVKQQQGTAGPGNMLGCCLVSFHFLWAILCLQAVQSAICPPPIPELMRPLIWRHFRSMQSFP